MMSAFRWREGCMRAVQGMELNDGQGREELGSRELGLLHLIQILPHTKNALTPNHPNSFPVHAATHG